MKQAKLSKLIGEGQSRGKQRHAETPLLEKSRGPAEKSHGKARGSGEMQEKKRNE